MIRDTIFIDSFLNLSIDDVRCSVDRYDHFSQTELV